MTWPSSPYLVYGIPVNETQLGFKVLQRRDKKEKRRLVKLDHNNVIVLEPQDKRGQGPPLTVVIERGLHPVRSRGQDFGFPKENEWAEQSC